MGTLLTSAARPYLVGREKVREFALAVGETNPLYLDPDYARAAGYADVVAPPMFVSVFAGPVFREALWSPSLAVDRAMTVHEGQEFCWGALVSAGDEITTAVDLRCDERRAGRRMLAFETTSSNQRAAMVAVGTWTVLVRDRATGAAPARG
jgi:acyl dehydratase